MFYSHTTLYKVNKSRTYRDNQSWQYSFPWWTESYWRFKKWRDRYSTCSILDIVALYVERYRPMQETD